MDEKGAVAYPFQNSTNPTAARKRQFTDSPQPNPLAANESPQSRSPSPPLPSRLDRIPSPDSFKVKDDQKLVGLNHPSKKEKERNTIRSSKIEDARRSREKSRSPRRRSKSPPLKKRSRSRDRSRRSRSGSRDRVKRRSRSIERKRRRSNRSRSRSPRRRSRSPRRRSRSPRRRRSRSPRRRRSRSPYRRRSRSPSPPRRFCSKWAKKSEGLTRAVLPADGKAKGPRVVSTEEVEARLARHMINVKEKAAEEAKKMNLPGYLNPAMVNVHQFKQVREKRKLLWSKTNEKKTGGEWTGAFDDQNSDEKFRRLMGINENLDSDGTSKVQESRKVLDELEKEYEKSRLFQLSRGAGGVTGIGLGFGSSVVP